MGEIEYTVGGNNTIQVVITREMRGLDMTVPSGNVGVVTPCPPHQFRDNPTPKPDSPSVQLTGRYENTDKGDCFCTAQINQAGNYIFGWFQVICTARVSENYLADLPAATGHFGGEVKGQRVDVKIKFDSPPLNAVDGHIEFESSNVGNNLFFQNIIKLYFREDQPFRISRTFQSSDYTFTFRWAELRRTAPDPRLPYAALESLSGTLKAIAQAEMHPLRTEQVLGMRAFVEHHVKPVLREGLGGNSIERMGGTHNFYAMFLRIFSELRFLGIDPNCVFHNSRDISNRFRCSCGVLFREQQVELVKMLLLNILENDTTEINGAERPLLEGIYMLAQTDTGEEPWAFHEFRMLFGSRDGQPVLPQRVVQYKYECEIEYEQTTGKTPWPILKIAGGGRDIKMVIRRYSRQAQGSGWGAWSLEDTSHQFPGFLGIVKLEAEAKKKVGPDIHISKEAGVDYFEFKSFRRWNWQDFPGHWEIFKGYAAVKLPFNIYNAKLYDSAAVTFHGSGNLPAITADIENAKGKSINTDMKLSIQAGFVIMKGYLWAGQQDQDQRSINPRDLPSTSIGWAENAYVCFATDVEKVVEPDGRKFLGMVVAKNLIFFLDRSSHLRLDGHTSRTASWWHNNVLSIRRAQFTLQGIIDILGSDFNIPLSSAESQEGDGSVRLFGHGEQVAMEDGVADKTEDLAARRVDISISGIAIARLGDQPRGS